MDDRAIYAKTDAGREEIRTRAWQLSGALRNLLLLIDGQRTVLQLKEMVTGGKAQPDAIERLLDLGLIELTGGTASATALPTLTERSIESAAGSIQASGPIVPPGPPVMPLTEPVAQSPDQPDATARARYERLYTLMNELVGDYLGLRGVFMQLKIEKCSSADQLLALQSELGQALNKVHGKDVASELMARIAAAAR